MESRLEPFSTGPEFLHVTHTTDIPERNVPNIDHGREATSAALRKAFSTPDERVLPPYVNFQKKDEVNALLSSVISADFHTITDDESVRIRLYTLAGVPEDRHAKFDLPVFLAIEHLLKHEDAIDWSTMPFDRFVLRRIYAHMNQL